MRRSRPGVWGGAPTAVPPPLLATALLTYHTFTESGLLIAMSCNEIVESVMDDEGRIPVRVHSMEAYISAGSSSGETGARGSTKLGVFNICSWEFVVYKRTLGVMIVYQ